jgi:hypothetical protein
MMVPCIGFYGRTAVSIVVVIAFSSLAFCQTATPEPLPDRVLKAVDEAKANNSIKAEIEAGVPYPVLTPSVAKVLARFSVVEVVPIERQGCIAPDRAHILTCYALQIIERLLVQREKGPTLEISPPRQWSSRVPNRILLPVGGGEVEVNGITVHQPSGFGLQPLAIGSKYLLILDVNLERGTAFLAANVNGVFLVSDDGSFRPIKSDNPLASELEALNATTLSQLKGLLFRGIVQR